MKGSLRPPVIVLDDIAHCPDGRQVLIVALRVDVVEGLGGAGVPVRACEVNGNLARVRKRITRCEDLLSDQTRVCTYICAEILQ